MHNGRKREKTGLLKPLNINHIKSVFGGVPLLVMLDELFGLTIQLKKLEKLDTVEKTCI